jgi:hypothetical protein
MGIATPRFRWPHDAFSPKGFDIDDADRQMLGQPLVREQGRGTWPLPTVAVE